jgi:hypothetical protein
MSVLSSTIVSDPSDEANGFDGWNFRLGLPDCGGVGYLSDWSFISGCIVSPDSLIVLSLKRELEFDAWR